jgi:Sulfotransferase domain
MTATALHGQRLRVLLHAVEFDQRRMTRRSGSPRWRRVLSTLRRHFLSYYFVAPPLWRIQLRNLLDSDRVAPDFISIGTVRSTQLADYLMQHPCVALPLAKEIRICSVPSSRLLLGQFPTQREMKDLALRKGRAVTGYCAPVLPMMNFPQFAHAISPRARVIALMRDPVERAFAHWRWDEALRARMSRDPLWRNYPGFEEVVDLELESVRDQGHVNFSLSGVGCGYLRTGIYLPFLKQLERFYPRENILHLNSRDFFTEPVATAQKVYDFLGLPAFAPAPLPVRNSAPPARLDPKVEARLSEFFAPHNRALYSFLGRDFGWR